MNPKVAKAFLIILVILLVLVFVIPLTQQSRYADRESVVQESLHCITAVCVDDSKVGEECTVLTPSVSKVLITVDTKNTDHRIVRIKPTEAECR